MKRVATGPAAGEDHVEATVAVQSSVSVSSNGLLFFWWDRPVQASSRVDACSTDSAAAEVINKS